MISWDYSVSQVEGGDTMGERVDKRIRVGNADLLYQLFGNLDEHAKTIEKEFDVTLTSRDDDIIIFGSDVNCGKVEELFAELKASILAGEKIDPHKLEYYIGAIKIGDSEELSGLDESVIVISSRGKLVKPKTIGQKKYYEAIKNNDVTFGIGPAGTGKTYMAVAMAVRAFKNDEVSRIIITRPAVEAGESLGFLPGDLQMKIDPYLRPLYDALYDILGADKYLKYKERGLIEVAPLAYMRGRTLDDSFIILDEAQNTTKEQMKMFLTRFGFGSKVVVNGDATQVDLPSGKKSGLAHAAEVLSDVDEIAFVYLTERDVVRHRLVKKIIKSYEKHERKQIYKANQKPRGHGKSKPSSR